MDKQPRGGVIEHSASKWAATVIFAAKKYGRLHLCVDYRQFYTMETKDSYILPQMDEYMDLLGDGKVFTMLDAYNGYWPVSKARKNHHKTSFVYSYGTYQ